MSPVDRMYGIFQFSGENFNDWQFRVKSILKKKGILKVIAEAIIVSFIAESHLQYVRDESSAKKMWENLMTAFSKANFVTESLIRKKLQRLRFEEASPKADFFMEFDDLLSQLLAVKAILPERERVRYLFDGLPESYDPLVTALENLKEEELTLVYVKCRLLVEEEKRKERSSAETS